MDMRFCLRNSVLEKAETPFPGISRRPGCVIEWLVMTDVGGAINQSRLLITRVKHEWSHLWMWGTEETELETAQLMSNLLTPPGLVRSSYV